MSDQKKFIVSHAPFWHDGGRIPERSFHAMLATLPALLAGIVYYGMPAVGVIALSVSSAIFWELLTNRVSHRPITVGDGNAALIGLLFAMLVPAAFPWWAVLAGTFVAVIIGKQIYGGIGGNAFNPVCLGIAILTLSWGGRIDFDTALLNYDLGFDMVYPLAALKHFGVSAVDSFGVLDLLLGKQAGAIGSTFGLGLILGGIYLILRGIIRWEISLSFLVGMFFTAFIFNMADPNRFAGPFFHLLTGYSLIGAFFLATEDSSSPVNFIPMVIYGAGAGVLTILIRNIGAHVDGLIFAVLMMNLANPTLDRIRPKSIGKVA